MVTLAHTIVEVGKRPALIVVDATLGFTQPSSPLGSEVSSEIEAINSLVGVFRSKGLPIVFTTTGYASLEEASVFREKVPVLNLLVSGEELTRLDPRVAYAEQDLVINKAFPSAFFDTPLRTILATLQVDSVFVTGFSTSGCVRATAVDALQCNLRLFVVRDACGDRDRDAHESNLRDIGLKYGEVVSLGQVSDMLKACPEPVPTIPEAE